MDNSLPRDVQMQFMRPAQLERALREFPAVYVPFGLIEWHGRHLPLGNDALKAHAFLVKVAERCGGVVYPPVFFPCATAADGTLAEEDRRWKVPMVTALFARLKAAGCRVIIGVSGHNIREQLEMIRRGLEPVTADGTVAGDALFEVMPEWAEEHDGECGGDHAARWETSNMMFFYPELVDLDELGDGPLAPNMQAPDGIGGLDPREHAGAEAGRRNVEIAVQIIGRRARELLESLPEGEREFRLEAISPEHWWCV
ncbi:MAG: creatininase family protein [Candidatus Brocadiia bacterium]